MKTPLLVYGNCQGSWLANALLTVFEIQTQYEVYFFPNFGAPDPAHPAFSPDFWKNRPLVLRQMAPDNLPMPFEALMPSHCRQLRYPTLWGKFLWPFHAQDPRNRPEPGLPFGPYFYGDRLVVQGLAAGLTPAEIRTRCLSDDLARHLNLRRHLEVCFAELRHLDRQSDLSVADFIEKSFQSRRLFSTINHPCGPLLEYLLNHIQAWVLEKTPPENPVPLLIGADVIGEEEIPLHPQIITNLKLTWAFPDMKYRYRSRFLSFEEFITAYIDFEKIPGGTSAELWLERAEQAYHLKQTDEARQLLLTGLVQFPEEAALYQALGVLLAKNGEFSKAMDLFTRALAFTDHVPQIRAELYNQIGILQYNQGDPARAEQSLRTALQIAPGWKEAADNLREILNARLPSF